MPCSLDDDCFTKVRLAPCEPTHYSWLDFKFYLKINTPLILLLFIVVFANGKEKNLVYIYIYEHLSYKYYIQ